MTHFGSALKGDFTVISLKGKLADRYVGPGPGGLSLFLSAHANDYPPGPGRDRAIFSWGDWKTWALKNSLVAPGENGPVPVRPWGIVVVLSTHANDNPPRAWTEQGHFLPG